MNATQVIVFPGASLMDITCDDGGLRVSCPGCHAEQHFHLAAGALQAFVHEDACPVHERIERATRASTIARHG
jgi:hypothetical protein